MEIRAVRPEELEQFVEIERDAFVQSPDQVERTRELFYKPHLDHSRALFEDNEIKTVLQFFDGSLWVGEGAVKMPGISAVATPPHTRRSGYLKTLLTNVLEEFHSNGYAIATLYPFYFPFYKKFGFEQVSATKSITVNLEALQTATKSFNSKGRWRPVKPEEWEKLNALYQQFCKGRYGRLERDEAWWQNSLFVVWKNSAGRLAYLWENEKGEPRGYIIYQIKQVGNDPWTREMFVRDRAWLDTETYREILAFIANHDSQADKASWEAETSEEIFALLPDPREAEEKVWPGYMLRILDAEQALRERPYFPDAKGSFTIALRDDRISHNDNITLQVTVENGKASVESATGTDKAGLYCDVRQLSQIYAGYLSPVKLAEIGLLEVRNQAELEAAQNIFYRAGQPASFMADHF